MNKINPDLGNPRYKLYKDLDQNWSMLQIQIDENKNELNALYSKKIGRKEQLKINFLENRIKELGMESQKLK